MWVLHPTKKTSYFVKAGWPQEWITMAEDILRMEWQHYKLVPVCPPTPGPSTSKTTHASSKYFEDMNNKSIEVDTLEEWLSSVPVTTAADPISWWSAMEATGHPVT
ncbi:hypothetical protein DXG01_006653 [Tephrocybe rancida]|nr:hypothetical protein DXG01_006653 [Tephrocybe rancida]